MFQIAEYKYTVSFIKKPEWYTATSWTIQRQDTFKSWMINYLMNNKDARFEIMAYPRKDKKLITKVVNEFIIWYGWRIE